jgi:hypothetical protein
MDNRIIIIRSRLLSSTKTLVSEPSENCFWALGDLHKLHLISVSQSKQNLLMVEFQSWEGLKSFDNYKYRGISEANALAWCFGTEKFMKVVMKG